MSDSYHFIGIGGIGMSALAHIMLDSDSKVTGSDAKESLSLRALREKGASITIGHDEKNVEKGTVVFSSAIQEDNQELKKSKQLGLKALHRSELLDALMRNKKSLQVTGTHGKTTTTALLSHVLREASLDPSFVIGGMVPSFKTNGYRGKGEYFVAEADESDGSFLKTPSFGAIVTNCGKDHLSYWKSFARLIEGFETFFSQVKHREHLFWCIDDPHLHAINPPGFSYGFSDADLKILSFSQTPNGSEFDLSFQGKIYAKIQIPLFGKHNVLNASAVFGLALSLSIDEALIRNAFCSFTGVKRRLERKGEYHGVVCFDDYAHHPTEIDTTLSALRSLALERRVVVLFQPHRYTRTRDFWDEFLKCFKHGSNVFITDIFDAGESRIDGIDAKRLAKELKGTYVPKENLVCDLSKYLRPFDFFVTMGAGDISSFSDLILKEYEQRKFKYTLGVLYGGTSKEHEISIHSAKNIMQNLDPRFYKIKEFFISKNGLWNDSKGKNVSKDTFIDLQSCDVVLPALHGPRGEDGMVQGFLETLGIPYIGCGYQSSCICMNKVLAKQVATQNNIPVVPFFELKKEGPSKEPTVYPVWVKPSTFGSSIGIGRANNLEEFKKATAFAFTFSDTLIVESHIEGREVEFAILGNKILRVAKPCVKYDPKAPTSFVERTKAQKFKNEIPAKITDLECKIGEELAKKMYRASGCKGLARVDFFLSERGVLWFSEINSFPGFTPNSGYPNMWKKSQMSLMELINELMILAMN